MEWLGIQYYIWELTTKYFQRRDMSGKSEFSNGTHDVDLKTSGKSEYGNRTPDVDFSKLSFEDAHYFLNVLI